jgi:hypothetical protein
MTLNLETRMPTRAFRALLVAAPLAFAACKKPEAAAPPPPPPPAAPSVSDVSLGKAIGSDKKVTNSTNDFGPRDTVYASVTTHGSGQATLIANWTTDAGAAVRSDTQSVTLVDPATTEFHITRPRAWPVGKYKVHILLNGQDVSTKDFEVKAPH